MFVDFSDFTVTKLCTQISIKYYISMKKYYAFIKKT